MTRFPLYLVLAATLAVLLAGCGDKPSDTDAGAPSDQGEAAAPTQGLLLAADLPDAVNVFSAKKKAEGEEVTVFGRVRSEVDGAGAFMIVDTSLEYCGEGAEKCGCPTPWDYCCIEGETVAEASLPVEIRDAKGEVVDVAKTDVRLLDLVALKGKLSKTESGELVLVVTDGWFRRERPTLPDNIQWPE